MTSILQASPQTIQNITQELSRAYAMEMETVQNYLANSVNLVGIRAEEIKRAMSTDVLKELDHARKVAQRMHVLGGQVPGSMSLSADQATLQPPANPADVVSVIHGAIDAENDAITQYSKLITLCEGVDFGTQDMCIELLAEEESHRREFISFLAEYERI